MRISIFPISLALCLLVPNTALAATWEELFDATSGATRARVEMDQRSFRKYLRPGEKIITARLRMFFQENGTTSQAIGDYEIHCAARKAFRSNLHMAVEGTDRTRSTVNVPNKTMLEGKDYQDFIGLMEILCAR